MWSVQPSSGGVSVVSVATASGMIIRGRVEHSDGVTNLVAERLQPLSSVYPEARGILPSRHRSRDFGALVYGLCGG